jgi:hypothetical protein
MVKRRVGSQNCQFDSRPEKVKNRPDLLVYRWRVTYHWKALDKGYNFALDRILIRSRKIMGLQSCESPNLGDFRPHGEVQSIL